MQIRKPIVAGQFYPAQYQACIDEINQYLEEITMSKSLPDTITSGIVPHAGWIFSGSLALMTFSAIKQRHEKVHTFVIFGAAHGYFGSLPAVYGNGQWSTPIGEAAIDEDIADLLLEKGVVVNDLQAHTNEHSIEVQVPMIQYLFPGAKIVPIVVPVTNKALKLGKAVGNIIKTQKEKTIICIGSTDLTHYGPRYGFEPMGTGADALEWASEVNDKKFIDLALKLESEKMLSIASECSNACGPGAAAAAVEAAKELGKLKGNLLAHTNSNEIMIKKMGNSSKESVGYAAIIF